MRMRPSDFDGTGPHLAHGGDLGAARRAFPGATEPLIDLSTGINPHSYPLPRLTVSTFRRLPEPDALETLAEAAARAYGAPSARHVVCAPGTQILLPLVARLVPPGRCAVLSPTYAEHARAAKLAGHQVREVTSPIELAASDLAVVVNPNNPDGRLTPRTRLIALAEGLGRRGGLLVVDEAFMEVAPLSESIAGDIEHGRAVVLRSFGKFHGLAGVRLGFAIAAPPIAQRLRQELGPWAVSGPAIAIGAAALSDTEWARLMRARLTHDSVRLDAILEVAGFQIVGGTPLFRLARSDDAPQIYEKLGRAGILVRRFPDRPTLLRFGLPANEPAFHRLSAALS
ncbi:threonine-phosphate decarboxylase CobD [Segnochrobactrum spirostomi]|nr:threonine-phosphate decarboxylase CobD [Segnochrobactrum spirostomi]